MDTIRGFLEAQPVLTLFLAIGSGYLLGQFSIKGFALGVGAVLFTGLAIGAIAPGATPPAMVSTIGLLMFLYGVGIQYGQQFVEGLTGPGLRWNVLALVGVLASMGVALYAASVLDLSAVTAVGIFAGAGTSTPALQAAIDAARSNDPVLGYSVAYPVGVIGPILTIYAFTALLRPTITPPPASLRYAEVTINKPAAVGQRLAEWERMLPEGVHVIGVRRHEQNMLPNARMLLAHDDALLLVGDAEALDRATAMAGHADPRRIASDRRDLDVVRVHVSKPRMLGRRIADLPMPDFPLRIAIVRRGDVEILATPDLVVESGDRLVIVAPGEKIAEVRAHFGDSIRAVAEFSYVSVGFGMVLGLGLGAIPIPVPGAAAFRLGVAGGPLLMALCLGWLGRTGSINWTIPPPANLALRNFGLTIFLAAVAIGAGKPFSDTLSQNGVPMLLAGAAVVLTNVLIVMLGGLYVFRLPYDSMIGVVCGATGQPAIPAYAARLLESDRVDAAYATIFPTMAITKVVVAQIIVGVFGSGS